MHLHFYHAELQLFTELYTGYTKKEIHACDVNDKN